MKAQFVGSLFQHLNLAASIKQSISSGLTQIAHQDIDIIGSPSNPSFRILNVMLIYYHLSNEMCFEPFQRQIVAGPFHLEAASMLA